MPRPPKPYILVWRLHQPVTILYDEAGFPAAVVGTLASLYIFLGSMSTRPAASGISMPREPSGWRRFFTRDILLLSLILQVLGRELIQRVTARTGSISLSKPCIPFSWEGCHFPAHSQSVTRNLHM